MLSFCFMVLFYTFTHIHTHTHEVPSSSWTRSSEMFPSDGGEDRVDEVEERGKVGEHLRHTHTQRLKPKTKTF